MLGSLARWLRISGYDTEYRRDVDDELLINESKSSGRVLVTRDKTLVARALKQGGKAVLIDAEGGMKQLAELAKKQSLTLNTLESRCPKCNGVLRNIDKEKIQSRVPESSYKVFNDFWICNSCYSIYWRGSHWIQIASTIHEASELLEGSNSKFL